jgi:hypothetical protein
VWASFIFYQPAATSIRGVIFSFWGGVTQMESRHLAPVAAFFANPGEPWHDLCDITLLGI